MPVAHGVIDLGYETLGYWDVRTIGGFGHRFSRQDGSVGGDVGRPVLRFRQVLPDWSPVLGYPVGGPSRSTRYSVAGVSRVARQVSRAGGRRTASTSA
jgi:hypothetical protein